jgi:hypothetical protein
MAEAVAAFEVVETAAQGAAVGAVAVSQPTVPIVVRFHKLTSPSPSLGLSSHSLTYVKGRAYIFGGDGVGDSDNSMQILTLPSDLSIGEVDYQQVKAVGKPSRPLAAYSDQDAQTQTAESLRPTPIARSAHGATAIESNIFIFGGRAPSKPGSEKEAALIDEQGSVHVYSTLTNDWTLLIPRRSSTSTAFPEPRVHASMTSTVHPAPQEALQASTEAHGTLILHGGYTREGTRLRDTWTFDVSSRMWAKWPDLPHAAGDGVASSGQIYCTESRLWHVGSSPGTVAYLDISRDVADDFSGKTELGIAPKTGQWEVLSFANTINNSTEKRPGSTTQAGNLPMPREGAGFLPVTSGAGRKYLLYFMGEDPSASAEPNLWTFQIAAEKFSPAVVKDKIRATFGANTGEHAWARCDVVQASKQEGEIERPSGGLARFAADAWTDWGGGAVVIWGGKLEGGINQNEGWVLTVD